MHVPGANPGTLANPEIPSEIRSTGDPRQGKLGREKQVHGDCKPTGLRMFQQSGIDLLYIPEDKNKTKLHVLS